MKIEIVKQTGGYTYKVHGLRRHWDDQYVSVLEYGYNKSRETAINIAKYHVWAGEEYAVWYFEDAKTDWQCIESGVKK